MLRAWGFAVLCVVPFSLLSGHAKARFVRHYNAFRQSGPPSFENAVIFGSVAKAAVFLLLQWLVMSAILAGPLWAVRWILQRFF